MTSDSQRAATRGFHGDAPRGVDSPRDSVPRRVGRAARRGKAPRRLPPTGVDARTERGGALPGRSGVVAPRGWGFPSHAGWRRASDVLARTALVLAALALGIVAAVSLWATVWLMTSAKDGNLTQSMSVYTFGSLDSWAVLGAGLAGLLVVAALSRVAWSRGAALDGGRGVALLAGVTFAFQLAVILTLGTRLTTWGDSWMIRDFVTTALDRGVPAAFAGPYRTIYYDARLYFSCYPFQASFFWLMLGLRSVFGSGAYMVLQVLNALANELAVVSVMVLGSMVTRSAGARRVLWVLVALCLPLYWLATFLYNNALGMGLAFVFLALQASAMRESGARRAAPVAASLVPLALALCIKATFVLFAIAVVLAWVVLAVRERRAWALAATLAVVLVANGAAKLPAQALERAAGYEFGDPLTTLNHLELGLRMGRGEFYVSVDGGEATFAPGGWSDHATRVWAAAGENSEVESAMAAKNLAQDVVGFAGDPSYAWWFFSTKLMTEWADPTYQSLYYLSLCADVDGERLANPADLGDPFGLACTVLTFVLDGYQTVVFVAACGFVAIAVRRWGRGPGGAPRGRGRGDGASGRGPAVPAASGGEGRGGSATGIPADVGVTRASVATRAVGAAESEGATGAPMRSRHADNPVTLLLALTFFTGFGCYLLWEAKSVYVFPFALVVLPLAAAGLDGAIAFVDRRLRDRVS